jgi:Tol biopolymer transport system component
MKLFRDLTFLALLTVATAGCPGLDLDLGGAGDGEQILFQSGYAFARDGEIYVADGADYQAAKRLTTSGSNSQPAISANGRVVVYVHTDLSGQTSLRRVSTGGGEESELVPASEGRTLSQPALDAAGSRVVFVSKDGSGGGSLAVVEIDGRNERLVDSSLNDSSPSFYPDGASVLALTGPGSLSRDELVRVELSAGVRSSVASGLGALGARAALSPDGTRIAFEMRRDSKTRIFVVDEAGGAATQISSTGGNDLSPTWVNDGRLGFASDVGGTWNVYELEVADGLDGSAALTVPGASECSYGGR